MNSNPARPPRQPVGRLLTAWAHRISRRVQDWQRADARNRSILIALLMGFGILYLIIIFITL